MKTSFKVLTLISIYISIFLIIISMGLIGCSTNKKDDNGSQNNETPNFSTDMKVLTFSDPDQNNNVYITGFIANIDTTKKYSIRLNDINVLGNNVIGILDNAFKNSQLLISIEMDAAAMGDKFQSIEKSAFEGSSIKRINLPAIEVKENAFANCNQLESVELSKAKKIGKNAFVMSETIYNGSENDFAETFEINLDNVTEIGESAFQYRKNLSKIGKLENLTTIGENAFSYTGNKNNEKNILNDTLKINVLNKGVFKYSSFITKVDLTGLTQKEIAEEAFNCADNLVSVTLPSVVDVANAITLGTKCFSMRDYPKGQVDIISKLETVENINCAKEIKYDAFDHTHQLVNIDFSYMPYLTKIEQFAFSSDSKIKGHIDLTHVTKIDDESFPYFGGGNEGYPLLPNDSIHVHVLDNLYKLLKVKDGKWNSFLNYSDAKVVKVVKETAASTRPYVDATNKNN